MNNCQYTQTQVLPQINKSFQEVGELSLEKPIAEAIKCYLTLDSKLFEAYMEQKIEPIVAIIEPSMYVGKYDWARCPKPEDTRDYVKEIIFNVISVHAEVDRVSPRNSTHVQQAMVRIVEAITEEVNRLFCVISRMNSNGCIQVINMFDLKKISFSFFSVPGVDRHKLPSISAQTLSKQSFARLPG